MAVKKDIGADDVKSVLDLFDDMLQAEDYNAADPSTFKPDVNGDVLLNLANDMKQLADGLNAMIQATAALDAQSSDAQIDTLVQLFYRNIKHLEEAIRESNITAAKQRVADICDNFNAYRKAHLTMHARFTNMVKTLPEYPNVLLTESETLMRVRSDIVNNKIIVLGEDDFKKLAVAMMRVCVEYAKRGGEDKIKGVEKSEAEKEEERETVADDLGKVK